MKMIYSMAIIMSFFNLTAARASEAVQRNESRHEQSTCRYAELNQAALDLTGKRANLLRIKEAEKIAAIVGQMNGDCINSISEHTVDLVTSNLDDDNDTVRSFIAIALGNMGAKAYRSLPALHVALHKATEASKMAVTQVGSLRVAIGPDIGSSSSIPMAIKKITAAHKRELESKAAKGRNQEPKGSETEGSPLFNTGTPN
jgi:hypothetical protein